MAMTKNEKNCADRVDSYVLQYRLDRAEVVSMLETVTRHYCSLNFSVVSPKHGFVHDFALAVGCVVSVFMCFIFSKLVCLSI